jgi:hypothetical protein
MKGSLKESLEGAGIGLLGGLVIGISDADWLRLAISLALLTYAGIALKKNGSSSADSFRIATMGLTAFLAIFLGLYVNGHLLFEKTPKDAIARWINAGYSPAEARELYLKQMDFNMQKAALSSSEGRMAFQALMARNGSDSLTSGSDSIVSRFDSLQALLTRFLGGVSIDGNSSSSINPLKYLFSSRLTANLCDQLDLYQFPDTASCFEAFQNTGIEELKTLILADSTLGTVNRYELARLLWKMSCTIESDTITKWANLTDPLKQNNNTGKIQHVYQSMEDPVFSQISEWIRLKSKDQIAYYTMIHAFIRRLSD